MIEGNILEFGSLHKHITTAWSLARFYINIRV